MGRHDKAFRALMAEEGVAEALLRERLPRAFSRALAGPPRALSEHFIDESLRSSVADLVLEAPLRGGETLSVCCLVEHKRTDDALLVFQVLRYAERLYARLKREGRKTFPPVVAIVVYNGVRPWRGPQRLSEVVKTPAWLRPWALDFGLVVVDVGAEPVAKLARHPVLRVGLAALKVATLTGRRRWAKLLIKVVRTLRRQARRTGDPSTLDTFVSYFGQAVGKKALPVLRRAMTMQKEKDMALGISEYLDEVRNKGLRQGMERGLKRGLKRGREEGREAALRDAVSRVLSRRFKKVPATVSAKLAAADAPTLEAWLDAAIVARSLRSVFAAH